MTLKIHSSSHLMKKLNESFDSYAKVVFNLGSLLEQNNNNFLSQECHIEVDHVIAFLTEVRN